jgi:hypothetical protein
LHCYDVGLLWELHLLLAHLLQLRQRKLQKMQKMQILL